MSKTELELERIALPICEKCGVYIYSSEYKKEGGSFYLRLFIDRDGGVTIDDCENVSRALSPLLDEKLDIKEAYIFEVSSPGIDRMLTRPWHFDKAIGSDIDIKLFAPIDGKKEISGNLLSHGEDFVTILNDNKEQTILKRQASQIRLSFKF